jgi:hypothetical protein
LEHGTHLAEGRWRPHHGDEGGLLLEALAEANKKDVDQLAIGNRIPEFTKFIGGGLDPLAVDGQHGLSLDGVAELGVETGDTCVDVVLEELPKRRPKLGYSGGFVENQIEDLGGDPRVDPLDDSEIILDRSRIGWARSGVGVDMVEEIASAKVDVKEMTPIVVIVRLEI